MCTFTPDIAARSQLLVEGQLTAFTVGPLYNQLLYSVYISLSHFCHSLSAKLNSYQPKPSKIMIKIRTYN